MKVNHKIKIHLDSTRGPMPGIDIMQGDAYTRELEFFLYSGGEAWLVPEGVSVAVAYHGASGHGIYDTLQDDTTAAYSVDGNVVTVTLIPQVAAVRGDTVVTVLFSEAGSGKQLATFGVVVRVAPNPAIGAGTPEFYYNIREWIGAGPLYVNLTDNGDGTYASDKTIGEIQDVATSGRSVYCVLETEQQERMILPMVKLLDSACYFAAVINGVEWKVALSDNNVDVSAEPIVIVISESPNLSEQSTLSTYSNGNMNQGSGWFGEVKAGETYTFSADFHKPAECDANCTSHVQLRVYDKKTSGTQLQSMYIYYGNVPVGATQRLSKTFTAAGDGYVCIYGTLNGYGEAILSCEIATNIQLEAGSVATEYQPYGAKELLDAERVLTTENKVSELEAIVTDIDKRTEPYVISESCNLSEKATASTTATGMVNTSSGWFGQVKSGETYTFSADFHKPADSGTKNIGVRVYSAKSGGTNLQEKTLAYSSVPVGGTKRLSGTFTATGDGYVSMNGNFNSIEGFSSYEIATNIQLELGETATEYKPYGEKTVADGEFVANLAERVEKVEEAVAGEGGAVSASYTSRVLSIAHQGASGYGYPQNTVENIIACAKDGWKYAEFDVRWTSDGVPVISHDDERTLYGSTETITISTSTYEELTAVQLFADANVKISTFYEVIDACKLYGLFACIEFKVWPSGTQLDDMVTYLKRRNMLRNCMWLSFNFDPLLNVLSRDANATVMLNMSSLPEDGWLETETRISNIVRDNGEAILAFNKNALTSVSDLGEYLNAFMDRGFKIGIWTLDDVDLIKTYALYADYVTSNVYKVEDALNA